MTPNDRPMDRTEPLGKSWRFGFSRTADGVPWPSRLFGVSESRSYVEVGPGGLVARFGPWLLRTTIDNIVDARITGPYKWWKVMGPAHYSFADHGITFATSTDRGVEISFCEPVPALAPTEAIRHPTLTVTVDDPETLMTVLG